MICPFFIGIDLGMMSSTVAVLTCFSYQLCCRDILTTLLLLSIHCIVVPLLSFTPSQLTTTWNIFSIPDLFLTLPGLGLGWQNLWYRSGSGKWEKKLVCTFVPYSPRLLPGSSCLSLTKSWVMLYVHKLCTVGAHMGEKKNRCCECIKLTPPLPRKKIWFQFLLVVRNLEKSIGPCAWRMKEGMG